jgi:hypothetical protein
MPLSRVLEQAVFVGTIVIVLAGIIAIFIVRRTPGEGDAFRPHL